MHRLLGSALALFAFASVCVLGVVQWQQGSGPPMSSILGRAILAGIVFLLLGLFLGRTGRQLLAEVGAKKKEAAPAAAPEPVPAIAPGPVTGALPASVPPPAAPVPAAPPSVPLKPL